MKLSAEELLSAALKTMDLPPHRKMSNAPDNLRWLLKNMALRNRTNPKYETAVKLITEILETKNVSVEVVAL